MKRYLWRLMFALLFSMQLFVGTAIAAELDPATRTVPLNASGETTLLSLKQVQQGKELFNFACSQCHVAGITKTDPNVGLELDTLTLASPKRDNLEALVDYMKNPTTQDGVQQIAELHPSTRSSEIFPKMRNLTEDDLSAIAGYILLQPKVVGEKWGGGKAYY
ncbi:MAG: cytochrome c-550 [Leptolyngbyaceae cyanobacterium RU_5_1]|nr:cytochrome c-550 [Leptolyngbyaceae cyanobacterium RU_5_1]